jgi:hypothetical protein
MFVSVGSYSMGIVSSARLSDGAFCVRFALELQTFERQGGPRRQDGKNGVSSLFGHLVSKN